MRSVQEKVLVLVLCVLRAVLQLVHVRGTVDCATRVVYIYICQVCMVSLFALKAIGVVPLLSQFAAVLNVKECHIIRKFAAVHVWHLI